MSEIYDLQRNRELKRLHDETDNTKVTPRELVTLIADVMDRNQMDGEPVRMVALVEIRHPDGTCTVEAYRAGCNRYEEIALVTLHQHKQVRDWALR